ncbi:MAG: hypothetical protein VYE50_03850, partial [Candidatus Thermoplasmatota archaeon]|nr:hypothetical protein [Candidatus Thermoplasmatota archaeon]
YYVPLKQLTPLSKQIGIGDVSSLNKIEARRMLKGVRSELNKRSKVESKIMKLEDQPAKKATSVASEEARSAKALTSLKSSLANRVQRSANPRWWHRWL